jgi:hypothetical protein
MYYLFSQLRISKSELESRLGKSLKDRYSPHPLSPHHLTNTSRFSVLRELLNGLPYHPEAMTRWHPNWLLLIEMMVPGPSILRIYLEPLNCLNSDLCRPPLSLRSRCF